MEVNHSLLNSEFKFKDGTARNASRLSKEKWEEHRELLCSLYDQKTISEIITFMRTEHGFVANAGQLGRKLREWGVYKYDSKNRPSRPILSATTASGVSQDVPIMLVDADLQGPAVQYPPDSEATAPIPPTPHSSPISNTDSKLLPDNQASATTRVGTDVASIVENILQAYAIALSLFRRIPEEEERTQGIFSTYISLREPGYTRSRGAVNLRYCYAEFLKKFGEVHLDGDSEILEHLRDILVTLENEVLSRLRRALIDDVRLNYTNLESELVDNEFKAIECLFQLSDDLAARTAAVAENSTRAGHGLPYQSRWELYPETLIYSEDWAKSHSKTPRDFHQIGWAQDPQELDENTTSTVSVMRTVIEEPGHGRPSDIDMDRFSEISASSSSSSLSGFASLRSLARRIKGWKPQAETNSMDEPPSSVMRCSSSSSSLQLFSRLSSRSSITSSRRTNSSRMSWRPEIPATT